MHKFSVKKPMTVFVAIIAVLVLGVVAYLKMTPDLLPNMDFPYAIVVTAYPGATPEKVESEVTKPLEQAMSTLEHIKNVSSTSAENVSMLTLEFEEAANQRGFRTVRKASDLGLEGYFRFQKENHT
jgi:HAE1 family hydrophobic/amphiphilic exporter-1